MKGYMLRKLAILTLSSVALVSVAQAKIDQQWITEKTTEQLHDLKDVNPKDVNKVKLTFETDRICKKIYRGNTYHGGAKYSTEEYKSTVEKPKEIIEVTYNTNSKDTLTVVYKDPISEKKNKEEIVKLSHKICL